MLVQLNTTQKYKEKFIQDTQDFYLKLISM